MKCRATLLLVAAIVAIGDTAAAGLRDARRDISALRYDSAERELVEVARETDGEEKQEALFLLAGCKASVDEAEMIYREIIDIDSRSPWAERAQVEMAKIQYAVGRYTDALQILETSTACRHSEEACYFQGLSAIMLKQYGAAREPLERVRSGNYRPWAYLALAEIDMNTADSDGACRRYEAIARSGLSPTGMYRYGECLEKQGDVDRATQVFTSIVRDFPSTPEAVVAAQKLNAFAGTTPKPVLRPAEEPTDPAIRDGFTLQFGAFHARENAIKLMAELKEAVPGVRIDSDLVDFREVHRVRVGYYRTRDEASKRAEELRLTIDEPITIMTLQSR